jgi:hypothetical protein
MARQFKRVYFYINGKLRSEHIGFCDEVKVKIEDSKGNYMNEVQIR